MPTTIAALESSASDHVSLQCQKRIFSISVDVDCQLYSSNQLLTCMTQIIIVVFALDAASPALPMHMNQRPDHILSLKESATAEQVLMTSHPKISQ